MPARYQLRILVIFLFALGIGGMLYKRIYLGYPLTAHRQVPVWTVEARIDFEPEGKGPVKVRLAVPGEQPGLGILEEGGISFDYQFIPPLPLAEEENRLTRYAEWARREVKGRQTLFYHVVVYRKEHPESLAGLITEMPEPDPRYREEPFKKAAEILINRARAHSADPATMASYLITEFSREEPSQNVRLLTKDARTLRERAVVLQNLLLMAGVETHLLRGLHLQGSRKRQPLITALLVRNGKKKWTAFLPNRPQPGLPQPFLVWQRGGAALLDVTGGRNARITFSVLEDRRPIHKVIEKAAERSGKGPARFSIYDLAIEQQNAFQRLLMVPFGALVVVILRNLVGIRTSGTFMPILLAMAFLQTRLLPGLGMFLLIVGSGLLVRSYLSRLNLLLVPRISAMVVVVIGIMVLWAVLGNVLHLPVFGTITFFPLIILAWTVERLSILWEEDGPREVAIQTAGSLLAAILSYFVMGNGWLRYLAFTFPEVLLVVLAIILLMGQYSGYRLLELRRFEPLVNREEK